MKNSFDKLTLLDIASKEKRAIISGPFGSNISSKYFTEHGIPVIRGNNLSVDSITKFKDKNFVFVSEEKAEELNTYAIENDIIFTAVGTLGQVGIIEKNSSYQKYIISNKQMRIRLDLNKVNPYYAYYWLTSSWILKSLLNNNTGSAVPLLNLGILKRTPIDLPKNRIYQDEVVNILSTLDKKIELNNQINQKLKAMAKMLYDYWFVQFDFPDADGKPYKSSGGKMVYSEALKREIPEGWEVEALGSVCDRIQSGGTPLSTNNDYYKGDINWFTTKELKDDILLDSENKITKISISESSAKIFPRGTVTIAIYASPTVGRIGILSVESSFNQACCGLIPNENLISKEYLFMTLFLYRKKLNALASGTTQKNLSVGIIKEQQILIPKNTYLKRFHSLIIPIFTKKEVILKETQKLTQLRDWLLPMLMNGQVTVDDAKEQIDELMVAEPSVGYGE